MQLITNSPRRSSVAIGRLLWPVVAFVVGVVVMGAVTRRSTSNQNQASQAVPQSTITVSALEGEVDYKHGDAAWQTVQNNTVLETDDAIRVVGKGHVALNLKSKGTARLGTDSALTITEVNDQKISLKEDRGMLYLRLPTDSSVATVQTGAASYAVKGASAVIYAGDTDGAAAITATVAISADGNELQTINPGQAYYVATKDPKSLRTVLPINDITVAADEFLQWNATQDRDAGISNDDLGILGKAATTTAGSISLTAAATDKGIVVSWKVAGTVDVSRGFKVLKSEGRNPEFPGSSYQSEPQSTVRTHTWDITDGKTYHFRVCVYQADGTCNTYSNDVAVAAPSAS